MEQELDPLLRDIGDIDVNEEVHEYNPSENVDMHELAKELEYKANEELKSQEPDVIVDIPLNEGDHSFPEEETKPVQKKKSETDDRLIRKIALDRQEKRELKQKLNQMAEENQRLREFNERTERAATLGWEGSIKSEMDLVKKQLKESIELGDIDAHVNSQARLAELSARLNDIERYKVQKEDSDRYRQSQPQQQVPVQDNEDYEDLNPHRADFVERNDFLNPQSINHDPRRAEELINFSNYLNAKLIRQGKGNLIDTPNYYQALDKYVQENFQLRNAPELKRTSSKVMPVSGGGRAPLSKNYNLSSEEKAMARDLKMPEDEYKKFLLEGMQEKLMMQKRRERN